MSTPNVPDHETVRVRIETRPWKCVDEIRGNEPWEDVEDQVLADVSDHLQVTIDGRTGTLLDWREWWAER